MALAKTLSQIQIRWQVAAAQVAVICLSGLTFDMYHYRNVRSGLAFSIGTCPQEACRGFQKYHILSVYHNIFYPNCELGIKKVIATLFLQFQSLYLTIQIFFLRFSIHSQNSELASGNSDFYLRMVRLHFRILTFFLRMSSI